jgi:hypothetical protein
MRPIWDSRESENDHEGESRRAHTRLTRRSSCSRGSIAKAARAEMRVLNIIYTQDFEKQLFVGLLLRSDRTAKAATTELARA